MSGVRDSGSADRDTPVYSGDVGASDDLAVIEARPTDERAARALSLYCALGRGREQRLGELSEITGVHVAALGRWRSQYHWDLQAARYDADERKRLAASDRQELSDLARARRRDQLEVAKVLRLKAWQYMMGPPGQPHGGREIEGEEDAASGVTLTRGMDVFKGKLALEFFKEARAIEASHFNPDVMNVNVSVAGLDELSPERMNLAVQQALADRERWRSENDLPALEDGADALGDYLA